MAGAHKTVREAPLNEKKKIIYYKSWKTFLQKKIFFSLRIPLEIAWI